MGISGADGGLAALNAASGAGLVIAAVRNAAERTGTDFGYLLAQARVESGLNPAAKAGTSSARGLYQFTNATWMDTVRRHGAAHGLGWAADAIKSGTAGAGTAARATILSLRDNADAAALMAGEFARDNGAVLEKKLGRAVGATELYMAHFLGAGGAVTFLKSLAEAPGAVAASVVPAAAAANRSVFYGRDGAARTVSEVFARFEGKIEGVAPTQRVPVPIDPAVPMERGQAVPAGGNALPVADVSRARLAYMLLAELGA